ncbi:MAG: PqqD family peptide modification chaperone [Rhodococcus sp. (in: high G+C Gram-positive bacteria)]|uniref:PqqD family peptide modification chaperone n=1 Tax=Rhodococcus sp. TaxID=1831 RepID=UPI003BAF1CBB
MILDQKSGAYFQINEVAADMVSALRETNDIELAAQRIHALYDTSVDQDRTDLLRYLGQLTDSGLVNHEV